MAGELRITPLGGKAIEGVANGFKLSKMRRTLFNDERVKPYTMSTQFKQAYQELGLGPAIVARPGNRAIAMCIAAGLLRYQDLKRPGSVFKFTMEPAKSCIIQYRTDSLTPFGRSDDPQLRELWSSQPPENTKVPGHAVQHRVFTVSADTCNFVSASLWGLSGQEIVDQGLASPAAGRNIWDDMRRMGMKTLPQLAAHCALNGAVDLSHHVMTPQELRPTLYEEPKKLQLPLGVVLHPPAGT